MPRGIDLRLSAEILHILMLMGHGDRLAICDVNHPAASIAKDTAIMRTADSGPYGCFIWTKGVVDLPEL